MVVGMTLKEKVRRLYNEFGQGKTMGVKAPDTKKPYFFLHRTFIGEQDLLIIFNTKSCRYRCHFCKLPSKSSYTSVSGEDILSQFEYVMNELKHSLSILDRVTISNDGSVLDTGTMPTEILFSIARCVNQLRRVRTIVLETRLEFVVPKIIQQINILVPRAKVNILTGFETLDSHIRDNILNKQETLEEFEMGLDRVAKVGSDLTAFVIFKPSQTMTDSEAIIEASASIDYLAKQCENRNIDLTIRLNPMFAAKGSVWSDIAKNTPEYKPPRLTDIMVLASQKALEGVKMYIGLSTEGLEESWGTYRSREDFSSKLIMKIVLFNNGKISSFGGVE